jgi:4-amino-4-deoxy-L-arabinose transferase-like glycosyltransferase
MSVIGNIYIKVYGKIQALAYWLSMFPLNKKERVFRLLLFLFIIVGFALRFYELTIRPFNSDEAISTMVAINISKTGYPPVHPDGFEYWRSIFHTSSMAVFFQMFGISVFIARLPSVIAGTLTIPLIYIFGRDLFNKKVGLISAFLISINFLAIDLSREARMYEFLQFFYLLSLYFFYKGFEHQNGRNYKLFKGKIVLKNMSFPYLFLSAVTFILSLLSHRLTAMILISIMGYGFIIAFMTRGKNKDHKKPVDKYMGLFLIVIISMVMGLIIGLATGYRHQITSLFPFIKFNIRAVIYGVMYYGQQIMEHFPLELAFAAVGIIIILRKREKKGAFLMAILVIPLLLQLLLFDFVFINFRYIAHLIAPLLVLSAYGIVEIASYLGIWEVLKSPEKIMQRFFVILLSLAIIFAGSSYAFIDSHRGKIASPYWREACIYVLENSENNTSVVTSIALIPLYFLGSEEYGLRSEYPDYVDKNINIHDREHLKSSETLKNFTATHDNGWVLVDRNRWNWDEVITDDTKAFLQENFTYHPYVYYSHLFIYSWGYD